MIDLEGRISNLLRKRCEVKKRDGLDSFSKIAEDILSATLADMNAVRWDNEFVGNWLREVYSQPLIGGMPSVDIAKSLRKALDNRRAALEAKAKEAGR